jgi:hypothetical protein
LPINLVQVPDPGWVVQPTFLTRDYAPNRDTDAFSRRISAHRQRVCGLCRLGVLVVMPPHVSEQPHAAEGGTMTRRLRLGIALTAVSLLVLIVTPGRAPAQPPSENHFRCYIVSQQTPQPAAAITLDDQFTTEPQDVTVGEPVMFCPPTEKTVDEEVFEIEDEEEHYTLYPAPGVAEPQTVFVSDQFGTEVPWKITTPKYVMVPTAKTIGGVTFDDRNNLNHYWCYEASGPRVGARVTLDDQFDGPDLVRVTRPTLLCTPAEKVHDEEVFEIEDEELHLACYEIHGKQKTEQFTLTAENQFEEDVFQTGPWEILCAPAEKSLAD